MTHSALPKTIYNSIIIWIKLSFTSNVHDSNARFCFFIYHRIMHLRHFKHLFWNHFIITPILMCKLSVKLYFERFHKTSLSLIKAKKF